MNNLVWCRNKIWLLILSHNREAKNRNKPERLYWRQSGIHVAQGVAVKIVDALLSLNTYQYDINQIFVNLLSG